MKEEAHQLHWSWRWPTKDLWWGHGTWCPDHIHGSWHHWYHQCCWYIIKISKVWVDSATQAYANVPFLLTSENTEKCPYESRSTSVPEVMSCHSVSSATSTQVTLTRMGGSWYSSPLSHDLSTTMEMQVCTRCIAYNDEEEVRRLEEIKPSFHMIVDHLHTWICHSLDCLVVRSCSSSHQTALWSSCASST